MAKWTVLAIRYIRTNKWIYYSRCDSLTWPEYDTVHANSVATRTHLNFNYTHLLWHFIRMVCSTFWRFWKRDKNSDELLRENASDSNFNFFPAPFFHRRILINRLNSRSSDRQNGVWYAFHHTPLSTNFLLLLQHSSAFSAAAAKNTDSSHRKLLKRHLGHLLDSRTHQLTQSLKPTPN